MPRGDNAPSSDSLPARAKVSALLPVGPEKQKVMCRCLPSGRIAEVRRENDSGQRAGPEMPILYDGKSYPTNREPFHLQHGISSRFAALTSPHAHTHNSKQPSLRHPQSTGARIRNMPILAPVFPVHDGREEAEMQGFCCAPCISVNGATAVATGFCPADRPVQEKMCF